MTQTNAQRLADRVDYGSESTQIEIEVSTELRRLDAENAQLRAELEAVRRDAERYRVLRCYRLSGAWPNNGAKAPRGLIAFSANSGEPHQFTLSVLDEVLDDMLGYMPSKDPRSRPDYQEWARKETLERVAAIDSAQAERAKGGA